MGIVLVVGFIVVNVVIIAVAGIVRDGSVKEWWRS